MSELLPDYYSILGVHRTSIPDEVREGYKRAAAYWLPDRNRSTEAVGRPASSLAFCSSAPCGAST